jgi:DNA-binding transcriptional LysR family regulator
VPRIVKKILKTAPNVRLRVVQADSQRVHSLLEGGEVDLAIGAFPLLVKGIRKQRLFSTSYMGLARKDHPLLGAFTLDSRIFREQQVAISAVGGGHAHQRIERASDEKVRHYDATVYLTHVRSALEFGAIDGTSARGSLPMASLVVLEPSVSIGE